MSWDGVEVLDGDWIAFVSKNNSWIKLCVTKSRVSENYTVISAIDIDRASLDLTVDEQNETISTILFSTCSFLQTIFVVTNFIVPKIKTKPLGIFIC